MSFFIHIFICFCVMSMLTIIQEQPAILCDQKAFKQVPNSFVFNSIATRTKWNDFDISNLMDGTEIKLEVTPIINTKAACIGVQIESSSGITLTHRFDSPVPHESFFTSVDCKQIMGFGIEDGKVSIVFVFLYYPCTCLLCHHIFLPLTTSHYLSLFLIAALLTLFYSRSLTLVIVFVYLTLFLFYLLLVFVIVYFV